MGESRGYRIRKRTLRKGKAEYQMEREGKNARKKKKRWRLFVSKTPAASRKDRK